MELDGRFLKLDKHEAAELLDQRAQEKKRMTFARLSDNKIVAGLVLAFVLWLAAKVSGVTSLPSTVEQHEVRITRTEAETRQLRESAIERNAQFVHIKEQLDRLLALQDRRRER